MAARKKKTAYGTVVTILIIAALLWMRYEEVRDEQEREGQLRDEQVIVPGPPHEPTAAEKPDQEAPVTVVEPEGEAKNAGETVDNIENQASTETEKVRGPALRAVNLTATTYQIWNNCTLLEHRGNDGDSFHIRAPHGREEIRLYFVDAPESAARTYGNGDTNHKRIAQQGAAMGGLDQHETTQVGVAAQAFVKKLLTGKSFTIVTSGERVYNSHRKYAFVIVDWQGQPRYLHELLVAYGLGRIHTKPMTLPDNTAASRQKQHLYQLEKHARQNRYGAWGVR
jgi:endonuclease YncB( thermonuclease family)